MKHCLDRENGCNPYGDACSCGCNICMRIPQMEIEIVQGKESLLDLEIKRIEQAFVEKEKQLQKKLIADEVWIEARTLPKARRDTRRDCTVSGQSPPHRTFCQTKNRRLGCMGKRS